MDPRVPDPEAVLVAVEAHLVAALGADSGRASVTFLGTSRLDVLRFGPLGADAAGDEDPEEVRYATVGCSRTPMGDPAAVVADPDAPRAELVLRVRGRRDTVLRSLAVLAAAPAVEGLVLAAGATVDLGGPLWDGAPFSAVLLGEPGPDLPDLPVDGSAPVRFLTVVPLRAAEAAWKRVHGADALRALLTEQALDVTDPLRPALALPSAPPPAPG